MFTITYENNKEKPNDGKYITRSAKTKPTGKNMFEEGIKGR